MITSKIYLRNSPVKDKLFTQGRATSHFLKNTVRFMSKYSDFSGNIDRPTYSSTKKVATFIIF